MQSKRFPLLRFITLQRAGGMIALFILLTSFAPHKFYISKSTIAYNSRTGGYEVTCKLFTDDFERALGGASNEPLHLGSSKETADADQRVESYINDHFKITIDQQPILMRYVGKEVESDLTFCYFEFYRAQDFSTFKIQNTLLFEFFPDQQNIVDLTAHSGTQTAVCLKNQPEHVFFR